MANVVNNSQKSEADALFGSVKGDHFFKSCIVVSNSHTTMFSPNSVMPTFNGCHYCSNGFATDQPEICTPTHTLTHIDASVPGFHTAKFTAVKRFGWAVPVRPPG
jgi:hypothetical protein